MIKKVSTDSAKPISRNGTIINCRLYVVAIEAFSNEKERLETRSHCAFDKRLFYF